MKIYKIDYTPIQKFDDDLDDYIYFDFSFKSLLYKLIVHFGLRIWMFEDLVFKVKDFFRWED